MVSSALQRSNLPRPEVLGKRQTLANIPTGLDSYAKQWRLFADVANDAGMTLELLAGQFGPSAFLVLACLASMCRAMVGVAGGATRMALTQHFAQQVGRQLSMPSQECCCAA